MLYSLQTALKGCHDEIRHLGLKRMLEPMDVCFFWPGMALQVMGYVKKCCQCITFKAKQQRSPMESIVATNPLELVHIDNMYLGPRKRKEEKVLVVMDHFIQYAQAYVTQSQMAQTIAKVLWDNVIILYGLKEKILSDQRRNLESELITDLCRLTGTKKLSTSPYHHQTNGQCERFNSNLINMLGILPLEHKSNWKGSIGVLVHAYNCTHNSAMGFNPYFLMYSRQPQLSIYVTFRITPKLIAKPTSSKYIKKLRDCIRWAHRKADLFQWKEVQCHK